MSSDIDILQQINDIDLSKVETSFPLLATGVVLATIIGAEMKRDTEKKGSDAKPYIHVEFDLAQAWKTVAHDGAESKVVNPGDRGSKFTKSIYIGQYEDKKTGEMKWYGLDEYARLREAALGKAQPGAKINPAELIGQQMPVKLTFNPAPRNEKTGETYGPRTEVTGYIRKKA